MAESKKAGGGARKILLLAVLGLLLVALAYDYRVARPAVEEAYNKIAAQNVRVNADRTAKFTNEDVRELMGREPDDVFDDTNGDRVEVYTWRAGLPLKKHRLFTVFKKNGDDFLFYRHVKGSFESSTQVSKYDGTAPLVVDYGNLSDSGDQSDAEYGGEGGPPAGDNAAGDGAAGDNAAGDGAADDGAAADDDEPTGASDDAASQGDAADADADANEEASDEDGR